MSNDAGTALKEGFNYGFDCAATLHQTNSEAEAATSILVENKDTYMLKKCGVYKEFFAGKLCNNVVVDPEPTHMGEVFEDAAFELVQE